jgi:hypothetical protein
MLDIFTAGVLGTLNGDDILIRTGTTFHKHPIDIITALVLIALDKVPPQNEVLGDIVDTVSDQTHGDVVPRHATVISLAELVALPVFHALEVHDAVVIEFLAREDVVA